MENFSPFTASMRLFHAQSILGFVSMSLPMDKRFDNVRKHLFEASMNLIDIGDEFDSIINEKNPKEEKR